MKVEMGTVRYDAEVRHDGRIHAFTLPDLKTPVCTSCKKLFFTGDSDKQITAALRAHLDLLTPAEIQAALNRLGMTLKEAAEGLRIPEETLASWLDESRIQSCGHDMWLRVFFGLPEARAFCRQGRDRLHENPVAVGDDEVSPVLANGGKKTGAVAH